MNMFRVVSLCASFREVRGSMPRIASIFSGLASIPLAETRQPSSLLLLTPNIQFSGFNLSPALRRLMNAL
jgi:hypothetical protein